MTTSISLARTLLERSMHLLKPRRVSPTCGTKPSREVLKDDKLNTRIPRGLKYGEDRQIGSCSTSEH